MLRNLTGSSLVLCLLFAGCNQTESEQKTDPAESQTPESASGNGKTATEAGEFPPAPEPSPPLLAKTFVNQPAPEFVVEEWLTEKPEREGKMVLIDFWATWCGPCIKLVPKLNKVHKNHKDRLAVIGLSNETAETVRAHPGPKINYALAIDTKARMAQELEIEGIPYAVLIDPRGIVRWQGNGHALTEDVLNEMLDTYVR